MSHDQKDFLALSHGQEWVSFYESFDKLVQDNLSRSSELLRRAMALPEVADREVQQIRAEMEEKRSGERETHRELLAVLHSDLSGSHQQVSMLALGIGAVIEDLERLSQRVDDAILALNEEPDTVAKPAAPYAVSNGVAAGHTASDADSTTRKAIQFAQEESVAASDHLSDSAMSAVSATDHERPENSQDGMAAAAGAHLEEIVEIDLNALIESEGEIATDAAAASESQDTGDSAREDRPAESGQRSRPHWLSIRPVDSTV